MLLLKWVKISFVTQYFGPDKSVYAFTFQTCPSLVQPGKIFPLHKCLFVGAFGVQWVSQKWEPFPSWVDASVLIYKTPSSCLRDISHSTLIKTTTIKPQVLWTLSISFQKFFLHVMLLSFFFEKRNNSDTFSAICFISIFAIIILDIFQH